MLLQGDSEKYKVLSFSLRFILKRHRADDFHFIQNGGVLNNAARYSLFLVLLC